MARSARIRATLPPRFLATLGMTFLLLLAFCAREKSATFSDVPIILISIDTLRADRLAAYGSNRVATPAIDGLAASLGRM